MKTKVSDIFESLYKPEFLPEQLELASSTNIDDQSKSTSIVTNSIGVTEFKLKPFLKEVGIRLPLNEDEAQQVDLIIADRLNRIKRINGKIATIEASIDNTLSKKGFGFSINISKRPRLKKAIKVIFGKSSSTITYEMYKEALAIKRKMENESSTDPFSDEEEDE